MKTALIFLADGFEEIEAIGVADVLRRADVDALFVSIDDEQFVRGAHNLSVESDLDFIDLESAETDAIILPGGMPGSDNLNQSEPLKELLVEQNRQGKLIAAICAAPLVLGELGLLQGRSATCYPGFEQRLAGATIVDAPVVVDGNVITGKSPGSVFAFSLALVEYLEGPEKAAQVAAGLCLPS